MTTNADITVYNHKYNKDTRLDDWSRTVIHGVHFYVDNKVAIVDNGLKSADIYKVRIPEDAVCEKGFLPDDQYASRDDVSQFWTLQDGDIIVLGVCEDEIERPADLKEKKGRYCTIMSWSDNRFGGLPHWRVCGE